MGYVLFYVNGNFTPLGVGTTCLLWYGFYSVIVNMSSVENLRELVITIDVNLLVNASISFIKTNFFNWFNSFLNLIRKFSDTF